MDKFATTFEALTGNPPFPWQSDLYENWFAQGKFPQSCNLPTGLGKTSVIAIWLIALANGAKVPRRLVYVVNRRTVVDQTTDEVVKYRDRLLDLPETLDRLRSMCATDPVVPYRPEPLALSTLRGQFADNREWSADPSRPAVICGTVDMIGSRLLFSGYGVGFKGKPLHAGFLGQDALLVHDEAHLEPAFQELLVAIEREQEREPALLGEQMRLKVMELTATSRGGSGAFELTAAEKAIPDKFDENSIEPLHMVWKRMKSKKGLKIHPAKRDGVARAIGEMARTKWGASGRAVLIFVRTIDDVKTVESVLTDKKNSGVNDDQVQLLTGTLRGRERDDLATTDRVFARFMPKPKVEPNRNTVFLICTSAGEVGVDISADHMVCDLSTLESMAQRFGRVNRRGEGAAEIDVVYETDPNPKPRSQEYENARKATEPILERLPSCAWIEERHDASPAALGSLMKSLSDDERDAAFAPKPTILPVTDILFDAWALTTIKGKLPGRPPVEPYLHGITDSELPETQVAWREEVGRLTPELRERYDPKELLEAYPLKAHELLKEPSYRAFKRFEDLAKRAPGHFAWIVDDEGAVEVLTLKQLADKDEKERIERKTVLLDPDSGGLKAGMLDGTSSEPVKDVSATDSHCRTWDDEPVPAEMACCYEIDTRPNDEDDTAGQRFWYWWELPKEGGKATKLPVLWSVHVRDVETRANEIMAKFSFDPGIHKAVEIAAKFHDHGKRRKMFQTVLGNRNYPKDLWAKSGGKGVRLKESYRHEFGSLLDILNESDFTALASQPEVQDLILHMIATHHGYARPHFPRDLAFDPVPPKGANVDDMAMSVPRRFAKLQRKYGRWGLAYLESLLRAADWAASAKPSEFVEEDE